MLLLRFGQVPNLLASKLSNRAKSDKGVGQKVENAPGVCALFCEWGRQFSTSEGITDGEMEHE